MKCSVCHQSAHWSRSQHRQIQTVRATTTLSVTSSAFTPRQSDSELITTLKNVSVIALFVGSFLFEILMSCAIAHEDFFHSKSVARGRFVRLAPDARHRQHFRPVLLRVSQLDEQFFVTVTIFLTFCFDLLRFTAEIRHFATKICRHQEVNRSHRSRFQLFSTCV